MYLRLGFPLFCRMMCEDCEEICPACGDFPCEACDFCGECECACSCDDDSDSDYSDSSDEEYDLPSEMIE